jgi:hypothetical protein
MAAELTELVAELIIEMKGMRQEMKAGWQQLSTRIDQLEQTTAAKFDTLSAKIDGLNTTTKQMQNDIFRLETVAIEQNVTLRAISDKLTLFEKLSGRIEKLEDAVFKKL